MGCLMLGTWKQAESAAYLWDNIAGGAVLSTNIFFNIALLHLASVAAGCRPASENDDGACDAHVYGLKPSSMVTTVVMVGQMSAALAMPFVGAAVDYTPHRRRFGAVSAAVLAFTTFAQAMIGPRTWEVVAAMQIVSIASYVCHQVAVLSYLPGLSRYAAPGEAVAVDDERERFRVNSLANVCALGAQMGTLAVVTGVAVGLGLGDVDTAALGQFLVGGSLFLIFGAIWTRRSPCAFKEAAATKVLPPNKGLARVAASEVLGAWATIRERCPEVGKFLVGYALVNGGMTGFGSLAVVFMKDHLNMDSGNTIAVVALTIVFAIPSAFACTALMSRVGARRAFIGSIVYMTVVTVAAPIVLCGRECASLVFLFAFFWGVGFGIFYASNASYFTELIPTDAVSQFMSLYYFSAQILSWAPPAVYTLLNQLTSETHLSLFVLAAFFAASLPFFHAIKPAEGGRIKSPSSEHMQPTENELRAIADAADLQRRL